MCKSNPVCFFTSTKDDTVGKRMMIETNKENPVDEEDSVFRDTTDHITIPKKHIQVQCTDEIVQEDKHESLTTALLSRLQKLVNHSMVDTLSRFEKYEWILWSLDVSRVQRIFSRASTVIGEDLSKLKDEFVNRKKKELSEEYTKLLQKLIPGSEPNRCSVCMEDEPNMGKYPMDCNHFLCIDCALKMENCCISKGQKDARVSSYVWLKCPLCNHITKRAVKQAYYYTRSNAVNENGNSSNNLLRTEVVSQNDNTPRTRDDVFSITDLLNNFDDFDIPFLTDEDEDDSDSDDYTQYSQHSSTQNHHEHEPVSTIENQSLAQDQRRDVYVASEEEEDAAYEITTVSLDDRPLKVSEWDLECFHGSKLVVEKR